MTTFDVYAFGMIAPSMMYLLKDHYPVRSEYAEFTQRYKHIGGEAANGSIVLSRLGVNVKLDGNWINPDEDAAFIKGVFEENKIDITRVSFRQCSGPKEMLVVDTDSRTIFGTYEQVMSEESWNQPNKEDIKNAKVICLDPFFGKASQQAAVWAKQYGKPVVTVDCRFDDPIFLAASTIVISVEYLRDAYPDDPIESILNEYRARTNGTLIFTFGHKEIRYGSKTEDFKTFTPYKINPIDTTGAGDSFRAGIIYGLLQGRAIEESISFASAVAALVCTSFPGVLNSPNLAQVLGFIEQHRSKVT